MADPLPFLPYAGPNTPPLWPATYATPVSPYPPLPPPPVSQYLPTQEDDEVYCETCGGRIEDDDSCIEMFFGAVKRSPQTGRKMVMSCESKNPLTVEVAVVHYDCAIEFMAEAVAPDQFTEMINSMAEDLAEQMVSDRELDNKIEDDS
jgi:hypothetical protein